MSESKMSLDEYLEAEEPSSARVVLDLVPDAPDLVRVSRWSAGGGCGCGRGFDVPRALIASVRPTGETHFCCGGTHRVCTVEWAPGASVPVANLLSSASSERDALHAMPALAPSSLRAGSPGSPWPTEPEPGDFPGTTRYQQLDPDCASDCLRHAQWHVRGCWGRFSDSYCMRQMNARYQGCLNERSCYWLFPWLHGSVTRA